MTRGLSVFVRENLEAFAVAIALALVVRHYSLEAFRIPSKSMMPTLIGSERGGDRILVDKYRWLFGEPHRWEPTVFQYPLNRSRNFIKRLAGLPGERLKIEDGDLFTSRDAGESWTIARKTGDAREALFFPYYPDPVEQRGFFARGGNWEPGPGWTADEQKNRFAVATDAKSTLQFRSQVVPYHSDGVYGNLQVSEYADGGEVADDLRVRFELKAERAGTLAVQLTERGLAHRLVLGPDGSKAVLALAQGSDKDYPLDVRIRSGGEYEVSFANADDALLVEVRGDAELTEEIPFPPEASREATGTWRHRVLFEAEGLKATIENIRIARDVQYTQDGEWPREKGTSIPEGHYFMLGDNTRSSKDSRAWEIAEVTLKDGTIIRWEEGHDAQDVPGQPNANFDPGDPDRVIEVQADVDGLLRRFHTSEVVRKQVGVPYPFVSRDHLVGRAFAIFWPIYIWPAVKEPTRVGLIR
ncbi:MAG TPA: signal peptidase I [Planctomycetota bacterium]|nr:signal peptidase I [Planctomycetota bacterium]